MGGAIPLFSFYAFVAWTGTRLLIYKHFTALLIGWLPSNSCHYSGFAAGTSFFAEIWCDLLYRQNLIKTIWMFYNDQSMLNLFFFSPPITFPLHFIIMHYKLYRSLLTYHDCSPGVYHVHQHQLSGSCVWN
jgi:hypothetical protein